MLVHVLLLCYSFVACNGLHPSCHAQGLLPNYDPGPCFDLIAACPKADFFISNFQNPVQPTGMADAECPVNLTPTNKSFSTIFLSTGVHLDLGFVLAPECAVGHWFCSVLPCAASVDGIKGFYVPPFIAIAAKYCSNMMPPIFSKQYGDTNWTKLCDFIKANTNYLPTVEKKLQDGSFWYSFMPHSALHDYETPSQVNFGIKITEQLDYLYNISRKHRTAILVDVPGVSQYWLDNLSANGIEVLFVLMTQGGLFGHNGFAAITPGTNNAGFAYKASNGKVLTVFVHSNSYGMATCNGTINCNKLQDMPLTNWEPMLHGLISRELTWETACKEMEDFPLVWNTSEMLIRPSLSTPGSFVGALFAWNLEDSRCLFSIRPPGEIRLQLMCQLYAEGKISAPEQLVLGSMDDFVNAADLEAEREYAIFPPNTDEWTRFEVADPAIGNIQSLLSPLIDAIPVATLPSNFSGNESDLKHFLAKVAFSVITEHNSGLGNTFSPNDVPYQLWKDSFSSKRAYGLAVINSSLLQDIPNLSLNATKLIAETVFYPSSKRLPVPANTIVKAKDVVANQSCPGASWVVCIDGFGSIIEVIFNSKRACADAATNSPLFQPVFVEAGRYPKDDKIPVDQVLPILQVSTSHTNDSAAKTCTVAIIITMQPQFSFCGVSTVEVTHSLTMNLAATTVTGNYTVGVAITRTGSEPCTVDPLLGAVMMNPAVTGVWQMETLSSQRYNTSTRTPCTNKKAGALPPGARLVTTSGDAVITPHNAPLYGYASTYTRNYGGVGWPDIDLEVSRYLRDADLNAGIGIVLVANQYTPWAPTSYLPLDSYDPYGVVRNTTLYTGSMKYRMDVDFKVARGKPTPQPSPSTGAFVGLCNTGVLTQAVLQPCLTNPDTPSPMTTMLFPSVPLLPSSSDVTFLPYFATIPGRGATGYTLQVSAGLLYLYILPLLSFHQASKVALPFHPDTVHGLLITKEYPVNIILVAANSSTPNTTLLQIVLHADTGKVITVTPIPGVLYHSHCTSRFAALSTTGLVLFRCPPSSPRGAQLFHITPSSVAQLSPNLTALGVAVVDGVGYLLDRQFNLYQASLSEQITLGLVGRVQFLNCDGCIPLPLSHTGNIWPHTSGGSVVLPACGMLGREVKCGSAVVSVANASAVTHFSSSFFRWPQLTFGYTDAMIPTRP